MRRTIELTEMLGAVELPEGPHDLWVALSGDYDEGSGRLTVRLTASLRHFNMRGRDSDATAGWLPRPESIVESVGPGGNKRGGP